MNDLQLAFQHSQATRPDPFPDSDLFRHLIREGYSVILQESDRFCGVTDARLPGCDTSIIAAFPNRGDAIDYWFSKRLYEYSDPEVCHRLFHPVREPYDDVHSLPIAGELCDSLCEKVSWEDIAALWLTEYPPQPPAETPVDIPAEPAESLDDIPF